MSINFSKPLNAPISGEVSEVNWMIIGNCIINEDNKTLIVISNLNRLAHLILNNEWFKELFNTQHPNLKDLDIFPNLQLFYPEHRWKVACCLFPTKGPFPLSSCSILINKIPASAFFDARIIIVNSLKDKKEKCEIRIKELCGCYFGDPAGLLDKAWKDFEKTNTACISYKYGNRPIIFNDYGHPVQIHDPSFESYKRLDNERFQLCEMVLPQIEKKLNASDELIFRDGFKPALSEEIYSAMCIEKRLNVIPLLGYCSALLKGILLEEREASLEEIQSIASIIQSCWVNNKIEVLGCYNIISNSEANIRHWIMAFNYNRDAYDKAEVLVRLLITQGKVIQKDQLPDDFAESLPHLLMVIDEMVDALNCSNTHALTNMATMLDNIQNHCWPY